MCVVLFIVSVLNINGRIKWGASDDAEGSFLVLELLQILQFGFEQCDFLYFELIIVFESLFLVIFDVFEAFELSVEFVVPGVEYGELEDEGGGADAETGDGQVSWPKHMIVTK